MKKLAQLAVLGIAILWGTPTQAAFQVKVTVSDGTTSKTKIINDGNAVNDATKIADGSGTGVNGDGLYEIRFNLSNVGFTGLSGMVVVLSNFTGDNEAGAQVSSTETSARNRTGTAGFGAAKAFSVTIQATQTGFLLPGSNGAGMLLTSDPSSTINPAFAKISEASFQSFVGYANGMYQDSHHSDISTITDSNPATSTTHFVLGGTAPPYSISNTLKFKIAAGGNSGTNSIGGSSTVTTNPVPPSIVMLAGALPFGLAFLRRPKVRA